ALCQAAQGRLDSALGRLEQASELEPLWFINLQIYSWELSLAHRFEHALEINERAARVRGDPFIPQRGQRALILLALGRKEEAVKAARFVRSHPEITPRWHADCQAMWVLCQA